MVCACHPDLSTIFGDQHGAILVPKWSFDGFATRVSSSFSSQILSNQFSWNLYINSKSV
jgi:hypothetical protein